MRPTRAKDQEVRDYVQHKLHQAYKGTKIDVQLKFTWVDFLYLGIGEQDFGRAVSLRDNADWKVNGLILTPAVPLLERLDRTELQNVRQQIAGQAKGQVKEKAKRK